MADLWPFDPKIKKLPEDPEGDPRIEKPKAWVGPQLDSIGGRANDAITAFRTGEGDTPSAIDQLESSGKGANILYNGQTVGDLPGFVGAPGPGLHGGLPVNNPPPPITGPPNIGVDPGVAPVNVPGGASRIPHLDTNQQYGQQNQDQYTDMLAQAALGLGPTQASDLAQKTGDRMLRQMQQQGAMGGGGGIAQAQMAAPMLMGELTQNASMLAAQEQNEARKLLGTTIDQSRNTDLRWDEIAIKSIQENAEINRLITDSMAMGYTNAAGQALDQATLEKIIQQLYQEQGRFASAQQLQARLATLGYTNQDANPGIVAQIAEVAEPFVSTYVSLAT